MHQGRGRRGGTFGAGPLSQPLLLSQVNGLSLNSSGGFHNLTVLSENPLARERKLTDVPPQGKLAARTIHLPTHHRLSPYLPLLLEFSLRLRCWWNLEHVRWSHTKAHWCNDWGDGTNFPQSLLPCTKISTARCKTILREWVCRLSYQEEEKRLIFALQLSSSNHLPTEYIWWSELQSDICQNDLIRVGLPLRVKVQTPRDMDTMKISPFWTGSPYWAGAGAGSSGLGFHMRGTVPNAKNAWAP